MGLGSKGSGPTDYGSARTGVKSGGLGIWVFVLAAFALAARQGPLAIPKTLAS